MTSRGEDRTAAQALAPGQRVVIVSESHPWQGSTGTLIESTKSAKLPWRVVLDDTGPMPIKAAVFEDEVRRV